MELNDWSDIGRFDEAPQNISLEANKDSERAEEPTTFGGLSDWSDLRQFDDDHDKEFFEAEEKHLAEQYGEGFLKVKYGDHGRVNYFCELCYADCNGKKSLEAHCSGMKHLKKKDMFEKEGKPQPDLEMQKTEDRPPKPKKSFNSNRDSRDYNRRENRRDSRSRSKERNWLPGRRARSRSRDRYSPKNRSMGREPFPFNPRGRSNGRGPGRPGGPGGFRNDSRYPPTSFSSSFGNRDGWERPQPPVGMMPMGPSNFGPGNEGRPFARNFDGPPSRGPPSPTRRGFYGDNFPPGGYQGRAPIPPSPPKYVPPSPPTYIPPSPPTYIPPSPPKFNQIEPELNMDAANLSKSPAGALLQKLAECCVKSSDDADLALNVVASLVKSLKDYSKMSGENKIAELLKEAELKVGTVKALKVGMKMLSTFTDPSSFKSEKSASSEAFIEGMKQALQEGGGGLSAAFNNSDSFHRSRSPSSKDLFGDAFDKYTLAGLNPSRPNY